MIDRNPADVDHYDDLCMFVGVTAVANGSIDVGRVTGPEGPSGPDGIQGPPGARRGGPIGPAGD